MFVFSGTPFAEYNVEHLNNVTFRISAMTKSVEPPSTNHPNAPQMHQESVRNPPGEVPQTTFGAVWRSFCLWDAKKVTLPFQIWDSFFDIAIGGTIFLQMGGPR